MTHTKQPPEIPGRFIDYTLKALEIADTRHGTAKLRRLIIQPGELLCM